MKKSIVVLALLLAGCDPNGAAEPAQPMHDQAAVVEKLAKDVGARSDMSLIDPAVARSLPKLGDQRTTEELTAYVSAAVPVIHKEWRRLIGSAQLPDLQLRILTKPGEPVTSPCNIDGHVIFQVRGQEIGPFSFCEADNTLYVSVQTLRELMLDSGYPVQAQQLGLFVALAAELTKLYGSELRRLGMGNGPLDSTDKFFFGNCAAGAIARGVGFWHPQWQLTGALDITGVFDRSEVDGHITHQDLSAWHIGEGLRNGLDDCIRWSYKI